MYKPLSELAVINPSCEIPRGFSILTPVSFISMSDVNESGHWFYHQIRSLGSVLNGFTSFVEGDVLVAKITPCMENGKGTLAKGLENGIGFGSTEFHVLRARSGTSSRFLFHISQSKKFRTIAETFMIGSAGQQRVQRQFFDAYLVPNLSFDEQEQIADILDTLDTTIRQTEAIIAKLQQVKQGLLHDLLTRGIDANGQLRPPVEQAPHLYKESPLGWIPREWSYSQLQHLASQILDGTHYTPTYTEMGVPFLRVTDLHERIIDQKKTKYISSREHQILIKRCKPEIGDVLLSKNGTVGIAREIDWNWEFSIFVSLALIKISHQGVISSGYLKNVINSRIIGRQISRRSKQGTVTNLHLEEIREFDIPLPTKQEQEIINSKLRAFQKKLDLEISELHKLNLNKSALMDDLLTGRVCVTALISGETPASKELERKSE